MRSAVAQSLSLPVATRKAECKRLTVAATAQLPALVAQDVGRELHYGRQDIVRIIGDQWTLKQIAWIFERVPDMFTVQRQLSALVVRRASAWATQPGTTRAEAGSVVQEFKPLPSRFFSRLGRVFKKKGETDELKERLKMKAHKTAKMSLGSLMVRLVLSSLILGVGIITAVVVGEVEGSARADLSNAPIQALITAANEQVLYATLADSSRQGIYRSDDNGRTWQLASPGPGVMINAMAMHPTNKVALYAGAAGGPVATTNNLWRSNDGGRTWDKFFLSLPGNVDGLIPDVTALAVDPHQPEILYVGTDGKGMYRFDVGHGGYGYSLSGDIPLYDAHIQDIAVGPDGRVYVLTSEGLFVSIDDAWEKLDTLPEQPAVSLAVDLTDPQTLYAGAPSSGAYRSTDGGQTWENISDGLGLVPGAALRVTALAVDERDPEHVAAATAYGIGKHLAGGGIFESHDTGRTWTQLAEIDELVTELSFNKGVLHAGSADGLVRYGKPSEPELPLFSRLSSLAQLTGIQVLILTATVGLVSLVLADRKEW